jgi:prepilin-type N-terminal cleavage/methylation domain-containing protein
MTTPRAARRARASERGVTLIELLVTIAVLAVGFVALLSAFAQTELAVGTTSDDAQLATRAGRVAAYIQSEAFAYVQCTGPTGAAPSGTIPYASALRNAGVINKAGDRIVTVAQATGGDHAIAGQSVPIVPHDCSLAGTGSLPDYGVQQIKFQVVAVDGRPLIRTVYKRWN